MFKQSNKRFEEQYGTFRNKSWDIFKQLFFSELDSLLCFPLRSYMESIGYGKWQKIGIITSFLLLLKSSRKSLRADIRVEASARICEDGLHKYTYIKYSFA